MICKHRSHAYAHAKKARNNFVIWILLLNFAKFYVLLRNRHD